MPCSAAAPSSSLPRPPLPAFPAPAQGPSMRSRELAAENGCAALGLACQASKWAGRQQAQAPAPHPQPHTHTHMCVHAHAHTLTHHPRPPTCQHPLQVDKRERPDPQSLAKLVQEVRDAQRARQLPLLLPAQPAGLVHVGGGWRHACRVWVGGFVGGRTQQLGW